MAGTPKSISMIKQIVQLHGKHPAVAVFYTLLGCCKAAGVNAKEWLEFIFDNLNDWKANRIKELLPDNRHNLRNTHNKAVQVT